ncbi:MAG: SCO family protein, partial [Alphaproteobacteria bacterium]|nr:SCO family protein [Alphaproteobacteria bacterium]
AAAGWAFRLGVFEPPNSNPAATGLFATAPRAGSGAPMPVAEGFEVGGPFDLIDQDGRRATAETFADRYMLIFFGYTFCPDICPTELGNISVAMNALAALDPELADRVVPIFVTVDPARDTVRVLKDYAGFFHPRLVALTGAAEEVRRIVDAYAVFVHLGEASADEPYLVDHSAFTYLMGPGGRFVAMFSPAFEPQGVAASIARLIGEAGS